MASRPTLDPAALRELLDNAVESPEVEYKRWMLLDTALERANVARHICALANHGGGYLVFGIEDDGSISGDRPDSLSTYDQDAINGIADRYLAPAPHCEVHIVASTSGSQHPVVRVPGHSERPVCAKSGGPEQKGKQTGIVAGTHYVRVQGPKSVPVTTPDLWAPIIRRCVFAERAGLLTSIGQLFDRPAAAIEGGGETTAPALTLLRDWDALEISSWPAQHEKNRVAFSFQLLDDSGRPVAPLPIGTLNEAIRSASFASAEQVNDGASSFEQRWQPGKSPQVALDGAEEAWEARILPDEGDRWAVPTIWRVAASGRGGDVTGFVEDSEWVRGAVEERSSRRWPPCERLSPSLQIQRVAQRLAFTASLAQFFPNASSCEIAMDYVGLAGRVIAEPFSGLGGVSDRRSAVDARRVTTKVWLATLLPELASTTAALVGPVTRLFTGWDVSVEKAVAVLKQER